MVSSQLLFKVQAKVKKFLQIRVDPPSYFCRLKSSRLFFCLDRLVPVKSWKNFQYRQ